MSHGNVKTAPAVVLGLCLAASAASAGDVSIRIDGFENDAGAARLVVMNGPESYAGTRPVNRVVSVPIRDGRAEWRGDLPVGEYAVVAHHDENANDALDRPLFGLPLEPYGYSNGVTKAVGLPDWDAVRFAVTDAPAAQDVTVRLNPFAAAALTLRAGLPALIAIFAGLALTRVFRTRA